MDVIWPTNNLLWWIAQADI